MAEGKWIAGLSPGMPVAEAARLVLAARLGVVRHYLPLAAERAEEDDEHVHQLRVGTRRAGAAIAAFAACVPPSRLRGMKRSLRRIRQAAGAARDADVFLAHLLDSRGKAPSRAFDFLVGFSLGERAAAQVRLVEVVDEIGVRFLAEAEAFPLYAHPPAERLSTTFSDFATEQLGEVLQEFETAIASSPDAPEALHQLRILGKQVRYAIEIFAPGYAANLKDVLYPEIESLQGILGDVQDAAVAAARLERLRERVRIRLPNEVTRLAKGIEPLIRQRYQTIVERRGEFREWRIRWLEIVKENPPEPLSSR